MIFSNDLMWNIIFNLKDFLTKYYLKYYLLYMAVCNIFSPLTNTTGNFLMFSNYVDDMNRYRVQDSKYRVVPSKFYAVDVNFNKIPTITENSDLNIEIPKSFQNMYENWLAYTKNHPEDTINQYNEMLKEDNIKAVSDNEFRKRMFWYFLLKNKIISPADDSTPTNVDENNPQVSNVKYRGSISLESYDKHGGEGYGEIICHIPSESTAKDYLIDFDNIEKWSGSTKQSIIADNYISGYIKEYTNAVGYGGKGSNNNTYEAWRNQPGRTPKELRGLYLVDTYMPGDITGIRCVGLSTPSGIPGGPVNVIRPIPVGNIYRLPNNRAYKCVEKEVGEGNTEWLDLGYVGTGNDIPVSGELSDNDKGLGAIKVSDPFYKGTGKEIGTDNTLIKSYKFNTVFVFYDIIQDNGNVLESDIPMGVYFTGKFENGSTTMSNEKRIYIQNADVFGASTTYALRICTRYTVNPNHYGIDTDLTIDPDNKTNISILLSKMADNIDAMNNVIKSIHEENTANKELYNIFKAGRVNVPYVKEVDGSYYWFVNGRLVSQLSFEEISSDKIGTELNNMKHVYNGYEEMSDL